MSTAADPIASPYVGLNPFESAYAEYFFGRIRESKIIADHVVARPVTVLYGPSGVGKSSILNVGLPKALAQIAQAYREEDAADSEKASSEPDGGFIIRWQREWQDPAAAERLLDGWITEKFPRPALIVLDQFEEYFLYVDRNRAHDFARALGNLVAPRGMPVNSQHMPVHLLFGIRDDALHRLDQLRAFIPGILNTTIELGGLNDAGIREAIVGPVTRYNENYRTEASAIRIEDGLVATLIGQLKETDNQVAGRRIAQDVKRRIELPYLQLALMKIWEAEGGNAATALREATLVTRLGGVGRIVRDHVNSVMCTLNAREQALCSKVFDRLVTAIGGKIAYPTAALATPNIVGPNVSEQDVDAVLSKLTPTPARILRPVSVEGLSGYEIFHDVLGPPILEWRQKFLDNAAREQAEMERLAKEVAERDAKEAIDRATREANARALAEKHARKAAEQAAREQKARTEAEQAARLQAQVSARRQRGAHIAIAAVAAAAATSILIGAALFVAVSNQRNIAELRNYRSWAVTNFRDFPDVGLVSAMAATFNQKHIWWGAAEVDSQNRNTLANMVAAWPLSTVSSSLTQGKDSPGFFLPGLKKFVFWSSIEGVEIVSWDGKQRSNIVLNKLVGEQRPVLLENVAEGATGTLLLRLTAGNHQILRVLRKSEGDPTTYNVDPTIYDADYFVGISKHAKEANAKEANAKEANAKEANAKEAKQEPPRWRLYSDRGLVYLFDYHRDSLAAEAFFMGNDKTNNWTSSLGWIDYKKDGIVISSLISFPQGMMVVRVYVLNDSESNQGLQFLAGGLKDIIGFNLQREDKTVWSLTNWEKSPASRCLGKFATALASCIFTRQDHEPSGLIAIQVPPENPTNDSAQRAPALADLIVVDVTTGKRREVSWDKVLQTANHAELGPLQQRSAQQVTSNLSVGGTINSLVVTVPNGRVLDAFSINTIMWNEGFDIGTPVAGRPSYIGTYTAPDLDGALYFSGDRRNMILVNGQEAKIWDISGTVQEKATSLVEGDSDKLMRLACKIAPHDAVKLKQHWILSGRSDDPPKIPCAAD